MSIHRTLICARACTLTVFSFTGESFNRDRQTGSWLDLEPMDVVALPPQTRMALARVDMGEVV